MVSLMTKTIILVTALAAIFVVSMLIAPSWSVGHVVLDESEVEVEDGATLDVKIKVTAKIPKDESSAFGYAALTDGGNKVLVLVTHVPAFDDSVFDDKKGGFHTHVLNLIDPTGACAGASFEIDLGAAITDPGYKNSVGSKSVKIKNVPTADLGDAGVETIAAFFATVPGFVSPGVPTNVCVTVTTTL